MGFRVSGLFGLLGSGVLIVSILVVVFWFNQLLYVGSYKVSPRRTYNGDHRCLLGSGVPDFHTSFLGHLFLKGTSVKDKRNDLFFLVASKPDSIGLVCGFQDSG